MKLKIGEPNETKQQQRKLHAAYLYISCFSQNTVILNKSFRWRRVARMAVTGNA